MNEIEAVGTMDNIDLSAKSIANRITRISQKILLTAVKHCGTSVKFIHVSHNDQDGYGCSVVMKSLYTYMDSARSFMVNPAIKQFNTPLMVPKTYETIDMAIEQALADPNHKPMVVLITDFGNITMEDIVKRYRYANHGDIKFVILDHHKSPYAELNPGKTQFTKTGFIKGADSFLYYDEKREAYYGSYSDGPNFQIYEIITDDEKTSATKLLYNVVTYGHKRKFEIKDKKYLERLSDYAELVSIYDTGRFGNWYVPVSTDPTWRNWYEKNVAPEIKLLYVWKAYANMPTGKHQKGSNMQEYIDVMSYTLLHGKDNIFMAIASAVIYTAIMELSEDYNQFCEELHSVLDAGESTDETVTYVLDNSTINGNDVQAKMIIPKSMNVAKNNIVTFHSLYTDRNPFTLFAKKYLTDHPDVYLVAKVRFNKDRTVSVDMRGNTDHANCYEIAKLNGGGGHPGAAGYPVI